MVLAWWREQGSLVFVVRIPLQVMFVNVQYLYAVCMVIVWYCEDWHLIGREGEGDAMMAEQRRDLENEYLYAILIYKII